MLASPNEPLPGQGIRAADLAAIIRYGSHTTARSAPGILVRTGSGGQTQARVRRYMPIPLQLSAAVTYQPFEKISMVPVAGDPTGDSGYLLTLQPGIISAYDIIAPQIAGNYIFQFVPTTVGGVTTYALPTLTVNKGDRVYLSCGVSSGVMTNSNVLNGTLASESDSLAVFPIGNVSSTGVWVKEHTGHLQFTPSASYFGAGGRLWMWTWNTIGG